jgi:hypothetical protein
MVAGFKSEARPASNRNTWPECVGICILAGIAQIAIGIGLIAIVIGFIRGRGLEATEVDLRAIKLMIYRPLFFRAGALLAGVGLIASGIMALLQRL